MLGPRFCVRALSSCGKRGPLFIAVRGPLTVVAPLVVEHRLQMRRLSSCGSRAHPLRGTWDLPRPGLEPVSPALAGRLPTTAPPGKPPQFSLARGSHLHTPRMLQHMISWTIPFPAFSISFSSLSMYKCSQVFSKSKTNKKPDLSISCLPLPAT